MRRRCEMQQTKFLLDEKSIPESWYNLVPDLPFGLEPPLNPATREPVGPEAFAPIFSQAIIEQEVTSDSYVPIPEEVREIYSLWRPTPLFRARRLERFLDTPAHIYYKYEGGSPTGSHKPNTAVPQAYYNREEGVRRLTTETGAGQWGSSLAFACGIMGLECTVYMVRVSYDQKPYRRVMMQTYGAEVHASPTNLTQAGRNILEEEPDSPGSLGIGISFPFIGENLAEGRDTRIIAVEPASCPTLTKGRYTYDFGDTAGTTPLMKMYTLGHSFVPAGIHAGGLRYHGDSPIVSALAHEGLIEARAYAQNPTFEAGVTFARTEGIVPAPEVTHAIKATIDLALEAKESGEQKTILFNLCGHGHFDFSAYQQYLAGELVNLEHSDEEIEAAVAAIPG